MFCPLLWNMLSLYPKKTFENGKKWKGNERNSVKHVWDNQVPEGRVFPAVDDDVDRAVEHEEDVGDVTQLGAPVRPVAITQALNHQSHLQNMLLVVDCILLSTSHLIHIDDNPDDIAQPKYQDHQYEHGSDALVPPLPGSRPLAHLLTAQSWALDCPEQGKVKGGQHQEGDQRHQDEVHNEDVVSEDMQVNEDVLSTWSRFVTCCMRLAFWAQSDRHQACCHWNKFSALEILEYWKWWQKWSLEWYRMMC